LRSNCVLPSFGFDLIFSAAHTKKRPGGDQNPCNRI
jgi:hypothetical protein